MLRKKDKIKKTQPNKPTKSPKKHPEGFAFEKGVTYLLNDHYILMFQFHP